MKATITIFKETGKFYTKEEVDVNITDDRLYELPDVIRMLYGQKYRGMHLIINAHSDKAWPMMLPADMR